MHRQEHSRYDTEQAEARPDCEKIRKLRKGRCPIRRLRADQRIDHAAEQNGFRELRGGKAHIGRGEENPQLPLGAEHLESASISAKKGHSRGLMGEEHSSGNKGARNGGRRALFSSLCAAAGRRRRKRPLPWVSC